MRTQGCADLLTNSCSVWFQVTVAAVKSSAFSSDESLKALLAPLMCALSDFEESKIWRSGIFWMMQSETHLQIKLKVSISKQTCQFARLCQI